MGVEKVGDRGYPRLNTFTSRTDSNDLNVSTITLSHEPRKDIIKTGWRNYAGIIFTILTCVASSFSNLTSKLLVERKYHPINIPFWKYQGMTTVGPLIAIFTIVVHKQNIFKGIFDNNGRTVILLLLRSTLSLVCQILYIYAVTYINLGDATVILFSTPITVFLFARIFLGESCGIVPVFATLITMIGVGVLTRPPLMTGADKFDEKSLVGISLALTAMLLVTGIFLITRYLRKVHFCLTIIFLGYTTSIESLIVLLAHEIFELPRSEGDLWITVAAAIAELSVLIFMVLSFKYEDAGPVAMTRTLDIVFIYILQIIFLGVFPDYFSYIGASIIMAGLVLTGFRKWLSTLPPEHPVRIKLWFVLK